MTRSPLLVLLPLLIFAALGVRDLFVGALPDLFIYRGGASLGWSGESPYSPKISAMVAAQWPEDESLIRNCGFFLPPQAIVLFGPFAALPWLAAKTLYLILTLAAIAACWYGLTLIFHTPPRTGWPPLSSVPWPLVWFVTLHLVTIMTFQAGQTTLLVTAAIVLGQLAHERGWPILSGLFWAAAFIKPHVALPLLPLAIYLGGWKRGALIIAWLGVLNLAGCLLAAGTPRFAFDYLDYLRDAHKAVEYNRIGWNPQITGWNRLWFSLSQREIELNTVLTLASYAVFAALFTLRCAAARRRPTAAWVVAVAATASVFCCQVLAYESFLLVLAVPLILEMFNRNQRILASFLCLLLVAHMLPLQIMIALGELFGVESTAFQVITSYRSWLVAELALLLLVFPNWAASEPAGS